MVKRTIIACLHENGRKKPKQECFKIDETKAVPNMMMNCPPDGILRPSLIHNCCRRYIKWLPRIPTIPIAPLSHHQEVALKLYFDYFHGECVTQKKWMKIQKQKFCLCINRSQIYLCVCMLICSSSSFGCFFRRNKINKIWLPYLNLLTWKLHTKLYSCQFVKFLKTLSIFWANLNRLHQWI